MASNTKRKKRRLELERWRSRRRRCDFFSWEWLRVFTRAFLRAWNVIEEWLDRIARFKFEIKLFPGVV